MTNYYSEIRSEVAEYIPRDLKKVLEVGCGEGSFRSFFGNEVEYWGIEPNTLAANIAKNKLSKVLNGTFDEVEDKLTESYFDLIVCNDVIEHMVDPKIFMQSIKKYMTSEAFMLISIPNVRYLTNIYDLLIKKDWQYRDAGILDYTHLRFFTKISLENFIHGEGYSIRLIEGINQPDDKAYKKCIFQIASMLLGEDVKYPQFVLVVQVNKS